ncbi:hypothetical protein [Stenotrophomonas sp. SMYL86]|uniref:hypothetical protein n=1 Tax=Stenotrophomonas sp. SMYL86 TaxID=3076044 RepID=UPI002E78C023|nr:hypothetical protein [Stenotrophomonas sp. SMYL86]
MRDVRFDALCSVLDGIQARPELIELTLELGLYNVPGEGSVEVWKGKALGAGIEILLLAPVDASSEWAISTLVTAGGRVEHIRRRPFRN